MEVELDVGIRGTCLLEHGGNPCRVCLTSNDSNRCIFRSSRRDSESTDGDDLSEMLRLCGGVEIVENDGLPSSICAKCIAKLNDAYQLRKQCQRVDVRLRELHGKALEGFRTRSIPALTKDQYCQTNGTFVTDRIKLESDMLDEKRGTILYSPMISTASEEAQMDEQKLKSRRYQPAYKGHNNVDSSNTSQTGIRARCKQTGYEKVSASRETYRTRRMTVFKRVTSMESLRNHKERQRQYIKKNTNVKRDSVEREYSSSIKNGHNGAEETDSGHPYICLKCNRCYSTKKSLDRHVSSHDEKKFACEKCNKEFVQLDKLVQHNKLHRVKDKPEPVLCKICNKNFRKSDTMVRHLNAHKRTNPKEVLSILKEIRDKRKIENTLETKITSGGTVEKDDVEETRLKEDSVANNTNDLAASQQRKLERRSGVVRPSNVAPTDDRSSGFSRDIPQYRCVHCDKNYATEKSLQRHLLIHDEKKFVCSVCNMKFFRQDRLKSHKTRYGHNEDEVCSDPQKPPDEKSAIKLINSWIREELDSDNEGKGFPCKICGKSYDTKKSLLKHQVNSHDAQDENCATCVKECTCTARGKYQEKTGEKLKPYRCDECGKSFEKEIKLQKHVRIHERAKEQQDANFKRFLCHICSKTFRQNTGLVFHMRTHTGYKPHVCKYCGRAFTSNSNCINHERTHTGDRPFVCHFCSAAFAKSCTLKAHITTHTGEANYHCKTCGKSFRRLKYLKEHRFTHTGEKPYACKICGTAYSHSGSLFVHEKKCKAQYNNYQSNAAQNTQSYCHSQTSSSPVVTPSITGPLPPVHLNNTAVTLAAATNKTYIDGIQRMNAQNIASTTAGASSDLPIHPASEISDVSSAVRSFALIGQMFQS